MEMPVEIEKLIEEELELLRNDPEHDIKPIRRQAIYNAFGPPSEDIRLQRMKEELEAVRNDPNLDPVIKAMRRMDIYKVLAPKPDSFLAYMLGQDMEAARRSPKFSQLHSEEFKGNRPDYYALIPGIEPIRYKVTSHLAIVTAKYVLPIWEESMSKITGDDVEEDLFESFYHWVEESADIESKKYLLEILSSFSQNTRFMAKQIADLSNQKVDSKWREATIYLLEGKDVQALIAALVAQGDKADWAHSPSFVTNYNLAQYLVSLAEGVLQGTVLRLGAGKVGNEVHYILGNIPEIWEISAQADDAGQAAIAALRQVLAGLPNFNEYISRNNAITDVSIFAGQGDAASSAVQAYANIYEEFDFIDVDIEKRLEFWEWWLTKAIPAAWAAVS